MNNAQLIKTPRQYGMVYRALLKNTAVSTVYLREHLGIQSPANSIFILRKFCDITMQLSTERTARGDTVTCAFYSLQGKASD